MRLPLSYGLPVAALVLFSGAFSARLLADSLPPPAQATPQNPTAEAVVRLAAVSKTIAQIASGTQVSVPAGQTAPATVNAPATEVAAASGTAAAPPGAATSPAADGAAPAVTAGPLAPVPQPKPTVSGPPAVRSSVKNQRQANADNGPQAPRRVAETGETREKIAQLKTVGPRQVGRAAWYGGHYVGQRTSSGERLDRVHATAAHRTLPLNSLARVTNLANGRSVVVRITDRGPVSTTLLIDMSPQAADQLAMKAAGVVPVSVEQVVEVPADSR
jgi:rare lipoprotein A (peptidoglycan hydrolase)